MNSNRISGTLLDRFLFCPESIWNEDKLTDQYAIKIKVFGHYLFCFNDSAKFAYASCKTVENTKTLELFGYGFFLKPHSRESNQEIIEGLLVCKDLFSLFSEIYCLAGRWVLFVKFGENIYVIGDASCSKPVFYCSTQLGFVVSSFEYTIASLLSLAKSASAEEFRKRFVSQQKGDWWCGNATVFDDVKALLPNHYLDLDKKDAYRFWPLEKLAPMNCENAYEPCKNILVGIFFALTERYKIALPVTGGLDSRLLLAASLPYRNRIFYFVANNNDLEESMDIKIPLKLFKKMNIPFSVIEGSLKGSVEKNAEFLSLFPEASEDRGKNFYRFAKNWPTDIRIILNGAVNEAGCRYYSNRLFSVSPEGLCDLAAMRGSNFARNEYAKWLVSAEKVCEKTKYELLDLFYWEHRTGRWMTKLGNDFEFSHEPIYAFNSRQYLDICLRIKSHRKDFPDRKFYVDLINYIAPEVLTVPVNPPESFAECLIRLLKRVPLEKYFRKLFYWWQGITR